MALSCFVGALSAIKRAARAGVFVHLEHFLELLFKWQLSKCDNHYRQRNIELFCSIFSITAIESSSSGNPTRALRYTQSMNVAGLWQLYPPLGVLLKVALYPLQYMHFQRLIVLHPPSFLFLLLLFLSPRCVLRLLNLLHLLLQPLYFQLLISLTLCQLLNLLCLAEHHLLIFY